MVLNAIGKRENLYLTQDELNDAMAGLAEEYGVPSESFADMLDPDELEGLKLELLCGKAMDFICAHTVMETE